MSDTNTAVGHWIDTVREVLARRSVGAREIAQIAEGLRNARDPAATEALLDARTLAPPAVLALCDGTLVLHDGGCTLRNDDNTVLAEYRFDDRRCELPSGTRLQAGDAIIDGEPSPLTVVELFGDEAHDRLLARLVECSGLDPRLAAVVLQPMLDVVLLDEHGDSFLPTGAAMTRERYEREVGAVLRREIRSRGRADDPRLAALTGPDDVARARAYFDLSPQQLADDEHVWFVPRGTRAVLGYSTLATADAHGLVHFVGRPVDLGAFELTSGTLSVSDPAVLKAKPERGVALAAQQSFGARRGTWRAMVVVGPTDAGGPRVHGLYVWHVDHVPALDAPWPVGRVGVDSGMVLVCDLSKSAVAAGQGRALAERSAACIAAAGPRRAARVEPFGVACASGFGDGVYALRVDEGSDDRVVALSVEFIASGPLGRNSEERDAWTHWIFDRQHRGYAG